MRGEEGYSVDVQKEGRMLQLYVPFLSTGHAETLDNSDIVMSVCLRLLFNMLPCCF
jgi:hypothetical protein